MIYLHTYTSGKIKKKNNIKVIYGEIIVFFSAGWRGHLIIIKTEKPAPWRVQAFRCGWAANYFPTVSRSIIVAAGLNFSVRNGKRCAPAP